MLSPVPIPVPCPVVSDAVQFKLQISNLKSLDIIHDALPGACLRAKSKYAGGGHGRGRPPAIR